MPLDILITVAVSSFIQSIFGVGVLLFGTPLLMLQGYSFFQAVVILLPISLLINLSQIAKDHESVDVAFYKKIVVYTIPFIVIFLAILNETKINIGLLISVLLLLVAAKDFSARVNSLVNIVVRYERSYFILMGIVHGLTNLGGSLLTAAVHSKGYEKRTARATVAASYATFVAFQIVTLFFSKFDIDITLSSIALSMRVGLTLFIVTEKIVYANIDAGNYRRLFAVFLFVSGTLLFVKSV